jgi:hypothetical protein
MARGLRPDQINFKRFSSDWLRRQCGVYDRTRGMSWERGPEQGMSIEWGTIGRSRLFVGRQRTGCIREQSQWPEKENGAFEVPWRSYGVSDRRVYRTSTDPKTKKSFTV